MVKAVCLLRFSINLTFWFFLTSAWAWTLHAWYGSSSTCAHTYPFMLNKCFIIKYLDVEILMLFLFSRVVQFVKCFFHSSEILLIYLNNLCCFRVLCYVLVLQCGNSTEDVVFYLWGVRHSQASPPRTRTRLKINDRVR